VSSLLGFFLLGCAFAVLVGTFVGVARLLGRRERRAPVGAGRKDSGAGFALVLGTLACGLFWLSPLVLALSLAGLIFSLRALRREREAGGSGYQAWLGLALAAGSVGLQALRAIGGGAGLRF
jgi:hypothetical protein